MSYEFNDLAQISYISAKKIVPFIVSKTGTPNLVVDLGGGAGGWCKAFLEQGTPKAICIDHPSLPSDLLLIDPDSFVRCDFEKNMPVPITCDVAVCIEFAEHISSDRSDLIIDFLVKSAPVVVFSAAIPNQGGIKHINEQHHKYWMDKFFKRGYECLDIIRGDIIFDSTIEYYLRQNIFLFVSKDSQNHSQLSTYKNLVPNEFEIVSTYILNKKPPFIQLIKLLFEKIKNKLSVYK